MSKENPRHPIEEEFHLTRLNWPTHGYQYKSIGYKVLAVASMNFEVGDWACYIDAVPGIHHDLEWEAVAAEGDKCDETLATILFPRIADSMQWRP